MSVPPFFKKAMQDPPPVKQPSSSDQAILSDMIEEAMDGQTISCSTAEVKAEKKNALGQTLLLPTFLRLSLDNMFVLLPLAISVFNIFSVKQRFN